MNKERYAQEQTAKPKLVSTNVKKYDGAADRDLELDKVAEKGPQEDLFGPKK